MLRKTIVKRESLCERLYERVENLSEIDHIEVRSERWKVHVVENNKYKYIVFEQFTAEGKLTGYIKVAPKSKAIVRETFINTKVEAKKSDCMYYKIRRTGK